MAISVLLGLGVAALFEVFTHAFEVDPSSPGAAAANHFGWLMALMLGSTVAIVSNFVVGDRSAGGRAVTSLVVAAGLWAGVSVAVLVHGNRPASLALLVLIPAVGAWFRRYGARGFAAGFPVHVGYVVGYLAGDVVGTSQLGWAAVLVGAAGVSTYLVGLLFLPHHDRATQRMRRSYRARAHAVLRLTGALMDAPGRHVAEQRRTRRLRRRVVRLNETALVLDAHLAQDPGAVEGAAQLRRCLGAHERAVTALAELAQRGAYRELDPTARATARSIVAAAAGPDRAALARFATAERQAGAGGETGETLERYLEAAHTLSAVTDHISRNAHAQRELPRPALLVGGWLPGAAVVNVRASSQTGPTRADRVSLHGATRAAIQLAVALSLAVTFGYLLSPSHVLWAVIAVYVSFLGPANDHEQARKAVFRVAGTVLGVLAGDGLAHLVDLRIVPTIAVIVAAMFVMSYLTVGRINYTLVVFVTTLGVTQFYAQAGELSTKLLITRVEETAIGAACAIFVGLAVVPLRNRHVANLALTDYLRAVAETLDNLPAQDGTTTHTRGLDAAFHTVTVTAQPLTSSPLRTTRRRYSHTLDLIHRAHQAVRGIAHSPHDRGDDAGRIQHATTLARTIAEQLPSSLPDAAAPSPAKRRQPGMPSAAQAEADRIADILDQLARAHGITHHPADRAMATA
ncbi:FUSC family protein [Streptomyces sp. NPDC001970]